MFNLLGNTQKKKEKSSDPLLQRLDKIRDSYSSDDTSYRFQAVFYNASKEVTSYSPSKPGCVSQEEWDQIVASAPNTSQGIKMKPKIICGFTELDSRIQEQSGLIERMKKKLKYLQDKIADLRVDYANDIKDCLTKLTEKNNEINLELMKFLQTEEVKTLQSYPFSREENEIYDKLEELSQEIHKPNKFKFSLNTLNLNAKMMRENFETRVQIDVPEESIKSSQEILKANSDALKALTKVIKQIYKSTDILSNQLNI